MLSSILFIVGLFVGSFLNVVIDRLPCGESFITGRSHCESCGKILAWFDLLPLLSFLQTQGQCRYCHTTLSWYYPFLELITGILFASTAFLLPSQSLIAVISSPSSLILLIYDLFIMSCLIIIFFIDLKVGIIPFIIIFPAIIVVLLKLFFFSPTLLSNHVLSGIGAWFFFLIIFLLTKRRGMGFGDVVYVLFMGLLVGFPGIVSGIYLAFVLGAIIALALIGLKKKKFRGDSVPFGPFLVIGTLIVLYWGVYLQNWFLSLMHIT